MKKSLTLSFIVIISIALTYALARFTGMRGFPFALGLNFLLMACALSFTETLKSPLNASYFDQKDWEKDGKIYERPGINIYRKLLVWTGWEKLSKQSKPVKKSLDTLVQLHYKAKQDELGHLIILVIVAGFNVVTAIQLGFRQSCWLLVLNVLLNFYPILLQRYNRPRIERAIRAGKVRQSRVLK